MVTLGTPAPAGGARVTLAASDPSLITPPPSVLVPEGATRATFTMATHAGNINPDLGIGWVVLSASDGTTSDQTLAGVIPPNPVRPPGGPIGLQVFILDAATAAGGTRIQGTVTLTDVAPPGGETVTLTSSDPAVTVPPTVTVPEGTTGVTFTAVVGSVSAAKEATLSATDGATATATLTVTPGIAPPPGAQDNVAIRSAVFARRTRRLSIQATSDALDARLKVYVAATGRLIGTLAKNRLGQWIGTFSLRSNPQNITVRSSQGGSAARAVSTR